MTAGGDRRAPLAWRSLAPRIALTAIPAGFTISVLVLSTTWSEKLLVGLTLGVTLASPTHGLLLVAALTPLGHLLAAGLSAGSFRISEALVVAFLTGWLVRCPADRPGPRVAGTIGWLLATSVISSIVGLAWQIRAYEGQLAGALNVIAHAYFLGVNSIGFAEGARMLEGIALVVATTALFRRRPSLAVTLPVALAAPAVIAGGSNLLLWLGWLPLQSAGGATLGGYRVSVHVADVNAAGSYFTMMWFLTLGMALREAKSRRACWIAGSAVALVGLWFSESRSALAAAAIVGTLATAWTASLRLRPIGRAVVLGAVTLVAATAVAVRVRQLESDPSYRGAALRQQFNATSMRMIEARPIAGVGIGQYYRLSTLFLTPQLAFIYGSENAHNYFLQIGAELGIVGLALFITWIGEPLARTAHALAETPRDWRLLGAASGVVALVGTSLTGHPLLVDEVAFPFWIQLGLTGALAGSTLLNSQRDRSSRAPRSSVGAVTAAAGIIVATLVSAVRGGVEPPKTRAVDGFYEWETSEDGTRYRWTRLYASLFVPADVTRVYIPVRMPVSRPDISPIGVEMMGGTGPARTWVGNAWTILNVELPDAAPPTRFKRIDLKIDRTWQPAVYIAGSSDLRSVGVQVGECRLFRER